MSTGEGPNISTPYLPIVCDPPLGAGEGANGQSSGVALNG